MRPFYFSESKTTRMPERLVNIFDGERQPYLRPIDGNTGPHGGPGTLITANDSPIQHVDRSSQQWAKIPGTDNLWLGWLDAERPTPAELQRADLFESHPIELADGNQWQIPIGRRFVEVDGQIQQISTIPQTIGMDQEGNLVAGGPPAQYKLLWEICDIASDHVASESETEVDLSIDDGFKHGADLLSINYRLAKFEVATFKLITPPLIELMLLTVLNFQFFKKKEAHSAISSTRIGVTDERHTIDQPMRSCG